MSAGLDPPATIQVGESLVPGYIVTEYLRRGSLLDVYSVWSSLRHCACVAKVVRPDRVHAAHNRYRLVREGHRLMRFSHPHIVRAYEVVTGPDPALILETLSGDTVAHLVSLNPGGLRPSDVVILGVHVCSAVQYMHAENLLHQDLKPSNIISERGVAKVLDLDVAQPPGPGHGQGTRQYMAPEQVCRDVLGAATDVWGIGVVLFEAATGHLPFESHAARMNSPIERNADPMRVYRKRWPRLLCSTIDAALRAEAWERPSLKQLADTLQMLV